MTVPRIKLNKYGKCAFSYIGPVTWNFLPKPVRDAPSPILQIQSENVSLQKASVLTTFTARHTRVLSKADSFLYLYILCSACGRMIVLTCCLIFTVLLRYMKVQCLGCQQLMKLLFLFTVLVDLNNVSQFFSDI